MDSLAIKMLIILKPTGYVVICYTAIAHWCTRDSICFSLKIRSFEVHIKMLFLKVFWSFWIPHIHLFLHFPGVEALKFCMTGCSWDICNLVGIRICQKCCETACLSEISCSVSFFKKGEKERKNHNFWMEFICAGHIWTCSWGEPMCKNLQIL